MNRDTYTFEERFLAWLLRAPEFEESHPNRQILNHEGQFDHDGWLDRVGEVTSAPLHMHQFEETSPRSSGPEPLKLGAKSVVQERYYALLKQRFQQEMEVRPPLFPWESELREYEDQVAIAAWEPQLRQLRLPVVLPDDILVTLFERCQALAQTALKDGRRLVEAVESLFPEDAPSLNLLANTVRLGYSRDGEALSSRLFGSQAPTSYESAAHQQKMTLAMVAAYEVLNLLTLDLSEERTAAEQSWQTSKGELRVKAERVDGLLRVKTVLPAAGDVSVQHGSGQAQSSRAEAGLVTLLVSEVSSEVSEESCRVQVRLADADAPLGFTIQL